jgi:hypothetical protein
MPPLPTGYLFPDPFVVFGFGTEVFITDDVIWQGARLWPCGSRRRMLHRALPRKERVSWRS